MHRFLCVQESDETLYSLQCGSRIRCPHSAQLEAGLKCSDAFRQQAAAAALNVMRIKSVTAGS